MLDLDGRNVLPSCFSMLPRHSFTTAAFSPGKETRMSTDQESVTAESAVRQLYEAWSAAVRKQDLDAVLSFYTDDVLAFDAILALQFKGKAAYRKHWEACMAFCPAGEKETVFSVSELVVQAGGDIAFVHGLLRCGHKEGDRVDASWMRLTAGLRRRGGEWNIAHEHFSAPFDMPSGKAMFHLAPDDDGTRVRPIPAGMSTVSPHIVCADASAAVDFYKKAFNAMEMPGGRLEIDGVFLHGEIVIGDSVVMIGQEDAGCGSVSPKMLNGTPVTLHVYVPDVDSAWRRAIEAGATEVMPVSEMFWGDRYGVLQDPFGHRWSLATHVRDVPPEEILKAAREFTSRA